MLTHRKPIIYFWFKSQIFGFVHENDDDFKIWRRKPMEQRERNSRRPSRNGLRFSRAAPRKSGLLSEQQKPTLSGRASSLKTHKVFNDSEGRGLPI